MEKVSNKSESEKQNHLQRISITALAPSTADRKIVSQRTLAAIKNSPSDSNNGVESHWHHYESICKFYRINDVLEREKHKCIRNSQANRSQRNRDREKKSEVRSTWNAKSDGSKCIHANTNFSSHTHTNTERVSKKCRDTI